MIIDLNHLKETNLSYIRHFTHGINLGLWLFLCSCAAFVNCFYTFKILEEFIIERIKTMYHGLMLRWFQDEKFNPGKPEKDALREKLYKKQYVELIEKGVVSPFSKIKVFYELLTTSISSIVHSFIPQILVHHAATNVIHLYFNFKIMEKSNDR